MNLRERLISDNRRRWLDIGCGGNFEPGFVHMDSYPREILSGSRQRNYVRCDIRRLPAALAAELGKFDLVRMQHVFEHFSYEEGGQVLKNCAKLLERGGVILITVPDLKVHVRRYLSGGYKKSGYACWAHARIPEGSPDSFYFSIFAHSMPNEEHKWCYDFEGLRHQLVSCGEFRDIRQLTARHHLSNVPFTHNRPDEDVCAIAVRA